MSVSVTIVSEGNNQRGPEIGDQGAIGSPDLEIRCDYNDDWGVHEYTFGWVYSGLSSIELVTREVADFREYLEHNRGRTIHLTTEGDDRDLSDRIAWEAVTDFVATPKPDYVPCSYQLEDTDSGDVFRFENDDRFDQLVPGSRTLTRADIENFIEKLVDAELVDDSFNNVTPLLHPYEVFGQIKNFVADHRDGTLVVTIRPV